MSGRWSIAIVMMLASACGGSVRSWTEALGDPAVERRAAAVRVLGEAGPAAAAAVPALIELLADESLVELVVWALGEIGGDAEAALPRLIELTHEGPPLRLAVLGIALGKIGANNAEVDECLQRLAQSPVVLVRQAAAGAMRGRR